MRHRKHILSKGCLGYDEQAQLEEDEQEKPPVPEMFFNKHFTLRCFTVFELQQNKH